jgi:small nuclear ribonucleoprotein (snRNP)-like protein
MLRSPWPLYERVLVNLDNGEAIKGLLVRQRRSLLVLTDAELVHPRSEHPVPMDGHIYIERPRVLFMQALKGGSP